MRRKKYKKRHLKKKKFSLILSGGSSLGLAHIGTIKYLEKNNLKPSEIIGTSMGSVIGSLYALGETSSSIEQKLNSLKTKDLFHIKYLQGKIEYKKARDFLRQLFKDKKISETKIPLKIIATKLKNGEEKVFDKSDDIKIYDAVLASIAIPGILNTKKIKNEIYIDGGVSSNLPLEIAKPSNIKLAINVINKKSKNYYYKNPKTNPIKNILTKFSILRRTSYYYILQQTEEKIKKTKKLILIEPNLKRFNSLSMKEHKKIIESGYKETKKYFDKAEKVIHREKRKALSPVKELINLTKRKTKKIIKNIQKLE